MKKLLALLLVLTLFLPALAAAETIVTSFYPVWILTLNLTEGIEGVSVVNLAEPATGCLHDYTPWRPQLTRRLSSIYTGKARKKEEKTGIRICRLCMRTGRQPGEFL